MITMEELLGDFFHATLQVVFITQRGIILITTAIRTLLGLWRLSKSWLTNFLGVLSKHSGGYSSKTVLA